MFFLLWFSFFYVSVEIIPVNYFADCGVHGCMQMACLGTWFSGGLDSPGLMDGRDLKGLFQP